MLVSQSRALPLSSVTDCSVCLSWSRLTASLSWVPAATLVICRFRVALPIETASARSVVLLAPSATLLLLVTEALKPRATPSVAVPLVLARVPTAVP
ncbi:hypothetical protein D9M73_291980 [compost metagenome]